MSKLSVEWFKNIPPEKRGSFEEVLRNSGTALNRLREIALEWERELETQEIKPEEFDNPAWAYKQARRIGDRSRIRKLLDLLSFLK